jgi:hypothetical protein
MGLMRKRGPDCHMGAECTRKRVVVRRIGGRFMSCRGARLRRRQQGEVLSLQQRGRFESSTCEGSLPEQQLFLQSMSVDLEAQQLSPTFVDA